MGEHNKNPHRFGEVLNVSKVTGSMPEQVSGYKSKFRRPSHGTMPPSSDPGALPQGCNNTLLHLSSLYDPATLQLAPLQPRTNCY